MKLKDCVLNVDWTVRSPLDIKRPKADWVLVQSEGTIPNSMYELYTKANFLSYGSASPIEMIQPLHLLRHTILSSCEEVDGD